MAVAPTVGVDSGIIAATACCLDELKKRYERFPLSFVWIPYSVFTSENECLIIVPRLAESETFSSLTSAAVPSTSSFYLWEMAFSRLSQPLVILTWVVKISTTVSSITSSRLVLEFHVMVMIVVRRSWLPLNRKSAMRIVYVCL
jgi:hypothetical protein